MKEVSIKCRFGTIRGLCWGQGNKKKILALHGWLDNAASFQQLAPLLAQIGYEVVAIDFAGHGHSDHRAEGHFTHFGDFVIDIHDVIASLKWEKLVFLGHSMGAAMALMYSAANPERVEKQILIENLGPIPAYEEGTAAENLREALDQWTKHSTKHKHYYNSIDKALKVRLSATPMKAELLKPLVIRGLKKTKKGYRWRTDKRLRLRSLVRYSEEVVQDFLSSKKPATLVIIALPKTYALNYPKADERLLKLNPDKTVKIKGHHHLHMDNAETVFKMIKAFLKK